MRSRSGASRDAWFRVALVLAIAGAAVVLMSRLAPAPTAHALQRLSDWVAPHRHAWYALPAVAITFVLLGLAMVPVLVLITATGLAFGPVLGPLYAMAGCLASASMGFAIGRWTGLGHIERVGGTRVSQIVQSLERNGTLAVFLLRKVPAPFLIANIVAGASRVRYRDFLVGTLLGMSVAVIALAGFGYQLTNVVLHPSPRAVLTMIVFVAIPLTLAWLVNRMLRQPGQTA